MRIVGGTYRGSKLLKFNEIGVRPTADRVRENLFNILGVKVINANFLDAFAGTGAMGIEALSRGAKKVTFLDNSVKAISLAEKNFNKLKIVNKVIKTDTLAFLERTAETFDVIFIDPPYASSLGEGALKVIGERNILGSGGVCVYEHEEPFNGDIKGLIKTDERKYGRVYLTFFKGENNG